MADEKKKTKPGIIAAICAAVVVVVVAVVAIVVANVNKGSSIVGKYTLAAVIDSNGTESTTTVEFMKALGVNYTIEFKDDKTGVLETGMDSNYINTFAADTDEEDDDDEMGDLVEIDDSDDDSGEDSNDDSDSTKIIFTYDDSKIKAKNSSGTFEAEYEFKDGAVILNLAGETMKFTRI